jgi:hypothetical protein
MCECTTAQLTSLVSSAETAEVLATAAMTVCAEEGRRAIEAGVARMRAEFPDIGDIREEFRSGFRTEVVTNAVQIRALANAPAKAALQPRNSANAGFSIKDIPGPDECVKTASTAREGKLVDEQKLVQVMLDLCRPEIEGAARKAFLADGPSTLDQHRASALSAALERAQAIVAGTQ